jgi:Zn-finger in Ran binding protein and others
VSVLAPIFKGNTEQPSSKPSKYPPKNIDCNAINILQRSLSMGSIPPDQKRCQLCLYNRYDLRPAKKPFNEKLHYQNKKHVTINNYPTIFKSSSGSCDLKDLKLLSLSEKSNRCEFKQEKPSELCDICEIYCKENNLMERSNRFTITRRNTPEHTLKDRRQLSSRGVFIAVEDWTETLKRNQFSNSVSMQDNYYENLKQLDNASSNDPSYENCSIFQDIQEPTNISINEDEPLYAMVNKNIKTVMKVNDEVTNNNHQSKPVKDTSASSSSNINSKTFKNLKKDPALKGSSPSRYWMCKCSYGFNSALSIKCDMCNSARQVSQSVSKQIKLLTLSKGNSTENQSEPLNINNNQNNSRLVTSRSSQALDEPLDYSKKVPMASFEQDLDDDFQFLPLESPSVEDYWTCKKCTLKNSVADTVCIVCGGSKLKSTSCREDLTLRKGEFWTCLCCTLKNSLNLNVCIACKASKHPPSIVKPPNFRPYTGSSPSSTPSTPAASKPPEQQIGRSQLLVASNRASRSPSPRHDRSGAIPKRHSTGSAVLSRSGSSYGSVSTTLVIPSKQLQIPVTLKTWQCLACTFENASTSVVCEICSSTRNLATKMTADSKGLVNTCLDDKLESKAMENLMQIEESEACTKWESIIQYCRENNELFVDDSFPPAIKSLYYNPNIMSSSDTCNPVAQWRRPKDINCDGNIISWSVFSQITPKVRYSTAI